MSISKTEFKDFLNSYWKSGGINKNDNVLIHSNLKNLILILKRKNFSFQVEDIIMNLLDFLGPRSTLIFPTFTFSFVSTKFFSVGETKSETGVMSEIARKLSKNNRTWHPVYSFAILGNVPKDQILKNNYSALGKESMFGWLIENNGKIVAIDLNDQDCMTIYHHIEEINNVNWRSSKSFDGIYEGWDLKKKNVTAKMFVRKDKDKIITNVTGMQKYLMDKDYYLCQNKNSTEGIRSIESNKLKEGVEEIINKGKAEGLLYLSK